MYIYIYTYIYLYTYIHVHTHTHTYTYTHKNVAPTLFLTHKNTYIHTYKHAYIHTCIHTYIHYIHTQNVGIHIYIYTYTHRMWHQGEDVSYALFDPQTKKPILITEYKLASERINVLMKDLLEVLHEEKELKTKLFQVYICIYV